MDDPTTFVMDRILAPFLFASLSAASVSAVSPDWLTSISRVLSSTKGSEYLNSDAMSVSTGIFASFSIASLPIFPA